MNYLVLRTSFMLGALLVFGPILQASGSLPSQSNDSASAPQAETHPGDVIEAVRVDSAPRVDGTLNDSLWQAAKPITDFRQREPYEDNLLPREPRYGFFTRSMPFISEFTATIRARPASSQRNFDAMSAKI